MRDLLRRSEYDMTSARFSPDGSWVVFSAHKPVEPTGSAPESSANVAPFRPGEPVDNRKWILISDDQAKVGRAAWSHDGNTLYFPSEMDGYRCLYGQRLEARTKRPLGEPVAVYHFHDTRRSLANLASVAEIGPSLSDASIVFAQGEITGNIWMVEPREAQTTHLP